MDKDKGNARTPGPWKAESFGVVSYIAGLPNDVEAMQVANCEDEYAGKPHEQAIADALLIAQAPAMLDALLDVIASCPFCEGVDECDGYNGTAHDNIRAILAAVDGGE